MASLKKREVEAKLLKPLEYKEAQYRVVSIIWDVSIGPQLTSSDLIISPTYIAENAEWQIALCTNNEEGDGDNEKYLSAYVSMLSPTWKILGRFSLAIETDSQTHYKQHAGRWQFAKASPCIGFEKYIPMKQIMKEEKLRFCLQLEILDQEGSSDVIDQPGEQVKSEKVPGDNTPSPPKTKTKDEDASKSNPSQQCVKHDPELNLDSSIFVGTSALPVDSKRMSIYSSVLHEFFFESQTNTMYDISSLCRNKDVMQIIIDFCHNGAVRLPNQPNLISELLEVAVHLKMPFFREVIEMEYLKNLTPQTFAIAVDLYANGNLIDPCKAEDVLAEYMIEHFEDLKANEHYEATFDEKWITYSLILLKGSFPHDDGSSQHDNDSIDIDNDTDDEDFWGSMYDVPPPQVLCTTKCLGLNAVKDNLNLTQCKYIFRTLTEKFIA